MRRAATLATMFRLASRPSLRLLAGVALGGAAVASLSAAPVTAFAAAPAPPPAGALDPGAFRSFKLKSRTQVCL